MTSERETMSYASHSIYNWHFGITLSLLLLSKVLLSSFLMIL